ncbi:NIPSNAP family protein [Yinghuangia seranimata]|uniref:NIPSNAP family protein n=1 Tax=Yinghuangia seranimata TaxID=408067 RepID=UPI00248D38E5|nr:NIPSNAP family protein [Yinghuangia seranimata]MDI2131963.1 NIPSNAP family protein [Yinghuangia seranimata]
MTAAAPVRVQDTVVLAHGEVAAWEADFRTRYVPGAERRGLTLAEVWHEHVGTADVAVHILWTLPSIGAFYGMRAAAGADPEVARFWADTDAVAVRRERHIAHVQPIDAQEASA